MSQQLVALWKASETSAAVWTPSFGAWRAGDRWMFRVWAPSVARLSLTSPGRNDRALQRQADGTFTGTWADFSAGDRYGYLVDGRGPFPDPASRFQPEGVHALSQLVDPGAFGWRDHGWRGVRRADAIIYELHVGTFTREGTFRAAAERLPTLAALGVTVIEVMPVADFPGDRNWGYDGVAIFAPARCYGTPDDFRAFVDTAHQHGLAVIQDVVYNHFGPDGAYHGEFSRGWFSDRSGPWGSAMNVDPREGRIVRAVFIDNALTWLHEYHTDGLRLDAIHALTGDDAHPFVKELVAVVRQRGPSREILITAEDDRNDARLARAVQQDGWGLDAVWADDFHHQVRRLVAGDDDGYYADYRGTTDDLAETINHGWFYRGQYSYYQGHARGTPTEGLTPDHFIICLQNHDQVGNRALGDRLHHAIDAASWRAVSALLFLAPETPLLFMGQEWAASSPFQYFTDHHGELGTAVTNGRRREFGRFAAFADAAGRERIPDPQAASTFEASRLDWAERESEPHASVWRLYRALIALRRSTWEHADRDTVRARALDENTIVLEGHGADGQRWLAAIRLRGAGSCELADHASRSHHREPWRVQLNTEDQEFAAAPQPVQIDQRAGRMRITFSRPGAVVLGLGLEA